MPDTIFPRITIFGGPGRSGESTLAKRFARELNRGLISGGDYMRLIAMRDGCVVAGYVIPENEKDWNLDFADTKTHRDQCRISGRDIDFETDVASVKRMVEAVDNLSVQPLVVESKTMARLLYAPKIDDLIKVVLIAQQEMQQNPELQLLDVLARYKQGEFATIDLTAQIEQQRTLLQQNTKAVWIDAELSVRASRGLIKREVARRKKQGTFVEGEPLNYNPSADEISSEIQSISARQINDAVDYAAVYGFQDFPEPGFPPNSELYGAFIENTGQTEDQSYANVCEALAL